MRSLPSRAAAALALLAAVTLSGCSLFSSGTPTPTGVADPAARERAGRHPLAVGDPHRVGGHPDQRRTHGAGPGRAAHPQLGLALGLGAGHAPPGE